MSPVKLIPLRGAERDYSLFYLHSFIKPPVVIHHSQGTFGNVRARFGDSLATVDEGSSSAKRAPRCRSASCPVTLPLKELQGLSCQECCDWEVLLLASRVTEAHSWMCICCQGEGQNS